MYLHTGWDKFARDLHLEPGCQLTFLYEGDGEMIVKVFDDTACRVHYPHTGESGSDTDNMTWYVVYKGKVPGVYNDWEECRRQWRTALDPVAHCPVIPSETSSGAPGTSAVAHVLETAVAHVHTQQWRTASLKQWRTQNGSSGAPRLDSGGALPLTNSGALLWSNSGALLDMSMAHHAVRHWYPG
ncbi:hypothetical protein QYE76_036525 [Lolium multiflorum]|uniref:TF-B3 domain-containing protein n=1 Tax=Lolium multiflorum TaxID=4521 RepID=A0AAD8R2Y7_LOLMU|nr:hypothetical protein QYE76_036525 [Lolium multiflorum]